MLIILKKIIVSSRTISPLEEQAYQNLKDYDCGFYEVKHVKEITDILTEKIMENRYVPKTLNITEDIISNFVEYAQTINLRHSEFFPGHFSELNSYRASFAKKVYFNNELEFIISLFISHHNIHAFKDGNKRTALNLFVEFIDKFTNFYIDNILIIQDAQILYLEKEINGSDFKQIIYYELRKKMFRLNMKCNLEHLIPRGDVENNEYETRSQTDRRSSFNLNDLENDQFFYQQLRKPIFQRDTNQWTVERLEKLILTFLDDGLIPAIILWEDFKTGDIYVIDGAHRISSLIAWVNSDYGKENELNDSNHSVIEEYINNKIGSYENIKKSKDEQFRNAKQIIAKRSIALQWVTGDYEKVKEAFIRINEQGVVITEDEKELIEKDKLPTSILSRSILSHGLGQASSMQNEDTKILFDRFFKPCLSKEFVFAPLAGSINEDFVISKIYNTIKIIDGNQNLSLISLTHKVEKLLSYLQDYLEISHSIYFYGATKVHKTNSLYGFIRFALTLIEDPDLTNLFIKHRSKFENYLVENENHIQIIARRKRQAKKAYEAVATYYYLLLSCCEADDFSALKGIVSDLGLSDKKRLSKREALIKEKYQNFISQVPRCKVCGGFIDRDDFSINVVHECCKK